MNKKILCLLLCGVLIFPLTGCDSRLTINGKDVFNFTDNKEEEVTEETTDNTYTVDEIIEIVKVSKYTLRLDGEVVDVFVVQDIINAVFKESYWVGTMLDENNFRITVYSSTDTNNENTEHISFIVNLTTGRIEVCELLIDGKVYSDDDASAKFAEIMAELSDNVVKKEEVTSEKKKTTEKKKEEDIKLDYVCAQCNKQMYKSMLSSKHENDFCSTTCQDKWYATQRELNEKKYKCEWCGTAMNQYQYDKWFGCCSEICAVNREGQEHENWERDNGAQTPGKDENKYQGPIPDGGITICGWCGARVMDDGAFCSSACEQAHHNYYN